MTDLTETLAAMRERVGEVKDGVAFLDAIDAARQAGGIDDT